MNLVDVRVAAGIRTGKNGVLWRRVVPAARLLLDLVLLYAAFILAYWIRYSLKVGPHIQDQLSFAAYQPLALLLLGIMIPVLVVKGAYRMRLSIDLVDEVSLVFSATTISVAIIVVIQGMTQHYQYSRGVIVYVWLLVIGFLAAGRALYRAVQSLMFQRGWGTRRLLVVGGSEIGKMVMQSVMGRRDFGYELVGFVDHASAPHAGDFGRFRRLGMVSDIPQLVEQQGIDEMIIALPASSHEQVWPLLSLCEQRGVGIKLLPDLFEMSLSRVRVDNIAGIPLLDVQEKSLRVVATAAKRTIDILVSGLMLVLSAPLLAVIVLLLRFESGGPGILCQERVGKNGKLFTCFKLRTMYPNAEDLQPALAAFNEMDGHMFKMRNDPRCTPLGRRVRRWSLDELPQLWNVFRGEMSLVGPRPALPKEVARYDVQHRRRLEVKPGMTGVWQVSGRNDLSFDEMVVMDVYYVDNWSPALDLKILARTILAVLAKHGAY